MPPILLDYLLARDLTSERRQGAEGMVRLGAALPSPNPQHIAGVRQRVAAVLVALARLVGGAAPDASELGAPTAGSSASSHRADPCRCPGYASPPEIGRGPSKRPGLAPSRRQRRIRPPRERERATGTRPEATREFELGQPRSLHLQVSAARSASYRRRRQRARSSVRSSQASQPHSPAVVPACASTCTASRC